CQWIDACITDAQSKYRVVKDHANVIGHSMGAGAALAYAALYPQRCGHVMAYAGYAMEQIHDAEHAKDFKAPEGMKLTIVHCENDPVVKAEFSHRAEKWFKEVGVN